MKPRIPSAARLIFGLSAITLAFPVPAVRAATYYWDNNGSTAGFGVAAGTWAAPTTGNATQGWSTNTGGTVVPGNITTLSTSATVDAVNFGNGATGLATGTITVSGTVQSGNITFASGSGGIELSGGVINLTNATTGPTLTVNSTAAASTIGCDLTGGLGGASPSTVTKAGNGTLYFSGNNTYLSRTSINAGVLVHSSANAIPGGIASGGSGPQISINGGILGLANGDFTRLVTTTVGTAGTIRFNSNGGFAAYGADRTVNFGGAGGAVGIGSGTTGTIIGTLNGKNLILGAADSTHKLTFANGVDVGGADRTVQVNNGSAAVDAEISGVIRAGTSGFGLVKTGTGTLLLSNLNTFNGSLTISAGTLAAGVAGSGGNSALGSVVSSRSIIVSTGSTLRADVGNVFNNNFASAASSLPALNIAGGTLTNGGAATNSALGNVTLTGGTLTATLGSASGYGSWNLNGTVTSTGTSTISTAAAVPITLSAAAGGITTFDVQSGTLTASAPLGEVTATGDERISGLTKTGSGTMTLSGTNAYTGATLVTGGTLTLSGTGGINSSSGITIDGSGAILFQASGVAVAPVVTLTQGTLTGNGTVNTVNVGDNTGGIISNNDGVAGAALTIGALTFTGAATVNTFGNASVPIVTTTLATNAAGPVTINPTAASWANGATYNLISFGGGGVGGAGSGQFVLGTVTGLASRQTPVLGNSGSAITLGISGDAPKWTGLDSGNWQTGATGISGNWRLQSAATPTNFVAVDDVLFDDTATGSIMIDINAANVSPFATTFNNSTLNYTLVSTGDFGIATGSLTKYGTASLTINTANTYAGGTTLHAGTLVLGNAEAIGTGTLTINGGALDSSVADLANTGNNPQTWNGDFSFVGTQSLNLGTGAVTMGANRVVTVNANTLTVGGAIGGGAFSLTKSGTGNLTLAGASTYSGGTTINDNSGTLQATITQTANALGTGAVSVGTGSTLILDDQSVTAATNLPTISNAFSGTGLLKLQFAAGTTARNTYMPNVTGFNGTIRLANLGTTGDKWNAPNLGTVPGPLIVDAGSTLYVPSGTTTFTAGITLDGAGNSEGRGAIRVGGATTILGGNISLAGNATISMENVAALLPGNITSGGAGTQTLTLGGTGSAGGILSGVIGGGTGTLDLATAVGGTYFLSAANTYTGLTTVNAGSLVLQNAGALGDPATGTTVANGARVELDNITVTGEPITLIGNGTNFFGALQGRSGTSEWTGNITIDADVTRIGAAAGAAIIVSGVIDDGINDYRVMYRVADTAASVTITGANTYTGGSSIVGTGPVIVGSLNSVSGGATSSHLGAPTTEANGRIIIGTTTVNGLLRYVGGGETTDRTIQVGENSATPVAGDTGGAAIENNGTTGALVFTAPNLNSPTDALTGTSPARTLTFGGSNTSANTVSGVIQNNQIAGNPTAPVNVAKTGAGSWTLAGANTYTGTTIVDQGSLVFTTVSQSLAGGLTFGTANGSTNNGTLDLSTVSATFAGASLVRTNSLTANTINIGATQQLALDGGLTLGYDAAAGTGQTESILNATGLGSMAVNGATIAISVNQAAVNAAYWSKGTLDVSGLAAFSTNVTNFNIGVGSTTHGPGDVILSNTANTILATTLQVGVTGGNNGRGTSTLTLGTGTNVIQADTINIGRNKSTGPGVVKFASQTIGSPGTVSITNKAGTGPANIDIANMLSTASGGGAIGNLDLRGHVATVSAATVTMGNTAAASNSGNTSGTLSFDAGTFDVNTLNMAPKSGAGTGTARATLNIGGGTFTVTTGFTMGSQTGAGASAATVNLTGGTLTTLAGIVKGAGTTTATINLNGGTLDLNGNAIGSGSAAITLNAGSGTLANVASINGTGGLTKTTAGTLLLTGTISYTGDTTVSEGTLTPGSAASPVNANSANDASTVTIAATGATLNLAYTGTDLVDKLFIGTSQKPAGVYGHTNSGANNGGLGVGAMDAYFGPGTGTLTVASGSNFASWITGTFANGTVPSGQQGATADPDNDGIPNLVEYAIAGQDPTVPAPNIGTFTGGTLSFAKRQPLAADITYAIVASTDLGLTDTWAEVTGAPPVYVNDATTISYTLTPGTPPQNFIRLQVTRP